MTEREALKLIADIASGSTTANSLPHIAKIAHEALAQPEQEPVAWPCVIAKADFSENTVTLTMQCTDYKVSAGKHWLCTTPQQRTWVGLTDEDWNSLRYDTEFFAGAEWAEARLKEKNT